MKGHQKVLVALNERREVLEYGIGLAGNEKAHITVVKVFPPWDGDLDLTGIKNLDDVLDNGGAKAVSEIHNTAKAHGASIETRLERGDVPQRILEVAEEEGCDLIIMGSKKKKGILSRIFGDHIVEKVAGRAPCPVHVVDLS
jgi:nucleotide-binding universal stress UspA family protein